MNRTEFKKTEIGEIPEGWREDSLGNVLDIIGGGTPSTSQPEYWGGDIPWISVTDFNQGRRWIYNTERTITEKGLDESSTRILPKGSLIISARGTVGEIAQLKKDMAFNQTCYGLNSKEGAIINDYLYYLLRFKVNDLKSKAHGSVFDTITRSTFEQVTVIFPKGIDQQRAIAKILSDLDDKIELNHQMNRTLEAIGQALFKRWFVDFHFPEYEKVKVANGIPEGWTKGTLNGIAKNPRRSIDPTKLQPDMPYIGLEHMPRKSISLNEWGRAGDVGSGKARFFKNDILFGKLRPYFHKVGVAPIDGVCSTDILTISSKTPEWHGYILGHMNSDELISYANGCSTGTKMPRVNWADLSRYEIALPPLGLIKQFNTLSESILNMIAVNISESRNIIAIRDSLLPRLMSGRIRVNA